MLINWIQYILVLEIRVQTKFHNDNLQFIVLFVVVVVVFVFQ